MPMMEPSLKNAIQSAVYNALARNFNPKPPLQALPEQQESWKKLSEAVAEMAGPIIDQVKKAETASDIPVLGITLTPPPVPVTGQIPKGTRLNIL